jgi:hypothetical protein
MKQLVASKTGSGNTAVLSLDRAGWPSISVQVVVNGTVNYTIQQTLDAPYDTSITPTWFDHPDTNLVAQTVNRQGNYAFTPAAVRGVVNSGTGTITLTLLQAGGGRMA